MKNILVTGGSGLVGTTLTALLLERGHTVVHVGRVHREGPVPSHTWDVSQGRLAPGALDEIHTIIHLAGAGIADESWTYRRKLEILESRVNSTRLLYDELKKGGHDVSTFIAASAIGYYGFDDRDEASTEDSQPGRDFLASVTIQWEREVDKIASLGIRVVKIRTGIVLSKKGGALAEICRPVKYYVGAPLGSGSQFMSWIHIDDLCEIYFLAIMDGRMEGAYNGVAPAPVTNREFTYAIAKILRRPILLPPIPKMVLRLLLGELAELVLQGNRISAKKILALGFQFKYPTVEMALRDLLLD